MKVEKLGDIATIKTGKYDVNHSTTDGEYVFYTCAIGQFKSPTYSFEGPAIILPGNGANVGEVFYYDGKFEAYQRTYVVQNFRADSNYIYAYFKAHWKNSLRNKQFGSATNYIRLNNLADFKIPLPPLPDQLHIANILSKAENLIVKRKESIRLLDEFLKSTFLEMFGDPVRNKKGWEISDLSELGSLDRGISKARPRNSPELLGGPHPLIQTGDVTNSGIYITAFKQTYSELGLKQSRLWPKGTMLITIAANIAQTSILTFDACFPDSVVGFVTNTKKANVLYVHFLFKFFQAILEGKASQTAQKNINLEILRNLKVPAPPIFFQTQFAQIVEKTEALKAQYQQSLQELENLYASLSQKAFKGELSVKENNLMMAAEPNIEYKML